MAVAAKKLLKVLRVRKLIEGAPVAQVITVGSPADGERLKVESVVDFVPSGSGGGTAVLEVDTSKEEEIEYSDVDEATDELVGVIRRNPQSHTTGVFVQAGTDPVIEKWAEGRIDDEEGQVVEVPVPASLYPMLRVGTYDEETAPTIQVIFDDDAEQLVVHDGPVGAVPSFDEDLEVLPPVGGGDASDAVTDPDTGRILPPAGMGYEDGDVPDGAVTPIVAGGIGNTLFVRIPTIANSSIVKYKVHCHTTSDFVPASNTLVGTVDLAGTPGFNGLFVIKDFPAGHALDGTAADPPQSGTTYYVKVVPSDGSGDAAGPYPQASATPLKIATVQIDNGAITEALIAAAAITTTKIADDSVSTPKLIAGAVVTAKIAAGAITTDRLAANAVTADKIAANSITSNEIAANTITAGNIATGAIQADEISGGAVTASKISVSSLSAISADLGSINAGSITGVTITGGTFRTGVSGSFRIEMSDALNDRIKWIDSSGFEKARVLATSSGELQLLASGSNLYLDFSGGSSEARLRASGVTVITVDQAGNLIQNAANAYIEQQGASVPSAPSTGHRKFHDNGSYKLKFGNGVVKTVATNV